MNTVFDILCILAFVNVCMLPLIVGEWLFKLAYKHIPFVKKKWGNYCKSLPDWEDGDEVIW